MGHSILICKCGCRAITKGAKFKRGHSSRINRYNATLTVPKVREIKQALREGVTRGKLAKLYKVSRNCIRDIDTGRTWKVVS